MVKRKSGNNIKRTFLNTWKFLLESKKYILFSISLFLLFVIVGFLVPPSQALFDLIKQYIEEILRMTEGMSAFELTWFIFANNIKVAFQGMLFGIFFAIAPFIFSMVNGYLIGFVAFQSIMANGIWSLWRLAPHGIFELPAIFISLGLGFRLGTFLFYHKKNEKFWGLVKNCLSTFFLIIFPLLLIAAIVEGVLIALA